MAINLCTGLLYTKPDQERGRRCVSEDRSIASQPSIGWRGTGGRSRHSSSSNLHEEVFRFLPLESLNQPEPPKLVIKKNPFSNNHDEDNENENYYEVVGENGESKIKRKKASAPLSSEDKLKRENDFEELSNKLSSIL